MKVMKAFTLKSSQLYCKKGMTQCAYGFHVINSKVDQQASLQKKKKKNSVTHSSFVGIWISDAGATRFLHRKINVCIFMHDLVLNSHTHSHTFPAGIRPGGPPYNRTLLFLAL